MDSKQLNEAISNRSMIRITGTSDRAGMTGIALGYSPAYHNVKMGFVDGNGKYTGESTQVSANDIESVTVKQISECRQCGCWGDRTMPSYAPDMCGYCSAQGNTALVWTDAALAIPFDDDEPDESLSAFLATDEQHTAYVKDGMSRDFVSDGPRGLFSGSADSASTLNRWIVEGYLHKHNAEQTPIRYDVCPCGAKRRIR